MGFEWFGWLVRCRCVGLLIKGQGNSWGLDWKLVGSNHRLDWRLVGNWIISGCVQRCRLRVQDPLHGGELVVFIVGSELEVLGVGTDLKLSPGGGGVGGVSVAVMVGLGMGVVVTMVVGMRVGGNDNNVMASPG